jgi:hypothetical protein
LAVFPGAIPAAGGASATATLAAAGHTSLHNTASDEIRAIATKIGTGSSTPVAGVVLRGTGAGISAWGQVDVTTDVTGVLPEANGGTGVTTSTGTGSTVHSVAPALTGGGSWSGSPTLSTPTIASFTNATHAHNNAAGGGVLDASVALTIRTLTAAQMKYGMVYGRQGGDANNWYTSGTTNYDVSATDVKIQVGTAAMSSDPVVVTFPNAFMNPPVVVGMQTSVGANNCFIRSTSITATTVNLTAVSDAGVAITSGISACWIAIGN